MTKILLIIPSHLLNYDLKNLKVIFAKFPRMINEGKKTINKLVFLPQEQDDFGR